MSEVAPIDVHAFYHYGYRGRDMMAIRSPFAMQADAAQLVGRAVRVDGIVYHVTAIARQITGPIAAGEPIGIEIAVGTEAKASAAEPSRR